MKLVHIFLRMVNMLGQTTWIQNAFNSSSITKKGEIESFSLVLVN
jgi:hypothetical protein